MHYLSIVQFQLLVCFIHVNMQDYCRSESSIYYLKKMPDSRQDLNFQRHMLGSNFVFNGLKREVVYFGRIPDHHCLNCIVVNGLKFVKQSEQPFLRSNKYHA